MSSIDINSVAIVEWVVSRLYLKNDWRSKINIIRQKITSALEDMPESKEIKELLQGKYINYFHCLKILEILKSTESETRNIFGQYSSKRYKDWQEIVKLYENNYLYFVDCAVIISQTIQFEIPAVRKAIEKNTKTETECIRKEKSYRSSANEANSNLKSLLKKFNLNIDINKSFNEDDIKDELKASLCNLKSFISDFESKINYLKQPYDLYIRYIKEIMKKNIDELNVCPLISYLLLKGNTTIYEWKYGKTPVTKSREEKQIEEINENDEIKWDFEDVTNDFSMIDFGIEIEDEGNGDVVQELNQNEGTENEMKTLFEDLNIRELLLDDLYELNGFLTCCSDDINNKEMSVLDTIESNVVNWDELNIKNIEKYRKSVQGFIDDLTQKEWNHLLNLSSSESYSRSIIERFKKENISRARNNLLANQMSNRIIEVNDENINVLQPRLEELKMNTKGLKIEMENALSKKFDNRRVRITGEILSVIQNC